MASHRQRGDEWRKVKNTEMDGRRQSAAGHVFSMRVKKIKQTKRVVYGILRHLFVTVLAIAQTLYFLFHL